MEQFLCHLVGANEENAGGSMSLMLLPARSAVHSAKHPHIYQRCRTPGRRLYFTAEKSQERRGKTIQQSQIHQRLASANHKEGKREEVGEVWSCWLVGFTEKITPDFIQCCTVLYLKRQRSLKASKDTCQPNLSTHFHLLWVWSYSDGYHQRSYSLQSVDLWNAEQRSVVM